MGTCNVESFAYLGSVIAKDEGADKDIKARIGITKSAFLALKPVWRSKLISQSTKLYIFKSNAMQCYATIIQVAE